MNENEYSQQNHFNSIQSWFYLNELLLNLKTIPFFFFTPSSESSNIFSITCIDGFLISQIDSIKYLGIIIDSELCSNHHIQYDVIIMFGSNIVLLLMAGKTGSGYPLCSYSVS